jgi:hypothetical protein
MGRQGPTGRLARTIIGHRRLAGFGRIGRRHRGRLGNHRFAGLDLLDRQLELGNLAGQLLRGTAELQPPQPGQLQLQLLELERLDLQRFVGEIALGATLAHQLPQALDILRKRPRTRPAGGGFIKHINTLT